MQGPMKPLREAVRLLEKVSPIRRRECDGKKKEQSCRWTSEGFKYASRRQDCGAPPSPFIRQIAAVHHASSPECKTNYYWMYEWGSHPYFVHSDWKGAERFLENIPGGPLFLRAHRS